MATEGPQWMRVQRTPETPKMKKRREMNTSRLTDETFLEACKKAGVDSTRRQASKWNNRKGKAYKYGRLSDTLS